ncbi:MAG: branched-chain amino acid transport system substrate-binding protein [Lysobacterales bacterium]|jgi:branched-chain amino acid transport system substrate-binding protein
MLRNSLFSIALIGFTVSCGESETHSTSEAGVPGVRGVTDTEIVLGSQNDLSGPAAILGVAGVNSARMRFDEANAAGGIHGRQIRFVVEDSGYQVPRAIQATNKLVNRDKIFAMVLSMGTPMNNAIMPSLFEAGVPNLFPISGARAMVEPFMPLQVTGRGVYYDEIRAATRYFIEEKGATTPCVVYQDSDYGQEILEGATKQMEVMGFEPAAVSAHKPAETEFTSTILRLRNAGCDLVLMGTIHRDTILIIETARKMDWTNVNWVGNNASYNEAVAAQESGSAEGYSVFAHLYLPYRDAIDDPAIAQWWDRYVDTFGIQPEYLAMEGYRNADVIVKALEAVGPALSAQKLVSAIESMSSYIGPFGYKMTFGPDDHKGVDESLLLTIVDGRWQVQAEKITY